MRAPSPPARGGAGRRAPSEAPGVRSCRSLGDPPALALLGLDHARQRLPLRLGIGLRLAQAGERLGPRSFACQRARRVHGDGRERREYRQELLVARPERRSVLAIRGEQHGCGLVADENRLCDHIVTRRAASRTRSPPSALDSRPSTWIETPASRTDPAKESAMGTGDVSKAPGCRAFRDLVADDARGFVGNGHRGESHREQAHGLARDQAERRGHIVLVQDGGRRRGQRHARLTGPDALARPSPSHPGRGERSRWPRPPSPASRMTIRSSSSVKAPSRASVR